MYSGEKNECDLVQNFVAKMLIQKYNKMYPKEIQNIPFGTEKSIILWDNLVLQQLALINEELSRKVLQCTGPEFFEVFLCINPKFLRSPDVFYRCFSP